MAINSTPWWLISMFFAPKESWKINEYHSQEWKMAATDLPSSDGAFIQRPDLVMKLALLVSMLISIGSNGFSQVSIKLRRLWQTVNFVHSQNVLSCHCLDKKVIKPQFQHYWLSLSNQRKLLQHGKFPIKFHSNENLVYVAYKTATVVVFIFCFSIKS